jgi:stage V sporulation protein B
LSQANNLSIASLTEGGAMLLVRLFTVGSGFLIVAILTRLLGPEGFGVYVLNISVIMLISVFMHLGLPTLITREIASDLARNKPDVALQLERFSLRLIIFMSLILGIICIITMIYNNKHSLLGILAPFGSLIVMSAAVFALQQRTMAILSGRKAQLLSQLPDGVVRPLAMLALLPVVAVTYPKNIGLAIGVYLFANVISLVVGTLLVAKARPPKSSQVSEVKPPSDWLWQLPPFLIIGLIGIVQANADTIILASILSIKEVSLYKVAAFIGAISSNFHSVVISLLLPRAAAAWATSDTDTLAKLAVNSSRSAFGVALAYAIVIWLFGDPLIAIIFGRAYADVYALACLLVVPPLITTAVGSSFALLSMCNRASISARLSATGVLIAIVGVIAGGYISGSIGAAIAAIVTTAFLSIASWMAVKRSIGIRCDIFAMSRNAKLTNLR